MNLFNKKNNIESSSKLSYFKPYLGIIIYVSIIAVGSFILYYFYPTLVKGEESNKDKKLELTSREKDLKDINDIRSKYSDLPEKVKILKQTQASSGDIEQILAQIEKIAEENNARLVSFSPGASSSSSGSAAQITVECKYADLYGFLKGMESNRLTLLVSGLTVASQGELINATINIATGGA